MGKYLVVWTLIWRLTRRTRYNMLRAISPFSSCIHWVRATIRAWSTWLPYSGHHVASNLCYHCEGRSRIAPRLAYLAENADACALDASSCVLLKLFGSARVSPHHGRAVAYNLWGVQRLKVHARCIRDSLFSFRILPRPRTVSLGIDFGLEWVERHRARRPQLSWQFVPNVRGTTFSVKGWMHRCTVAPSRIFAGKVARRHVTHEGGIKLVSVRPVRDDARLRARSI